MAGMQRYGLHSNCQSNGWVWRVLIALCCEAQPSSGGLRPAYAVTRVMQQCTEGLSLSGRCNGPDDCQLG